jgi:hypothetical protein
MYNDRHDAITVSLLSAVIVVVATAVAATAVLLIKTMAGSDTDEYTPPAHL